MLPTTWTALLLLVVAVLPGAMFTFAFERQAGAFGVTLADRVLRFVAASVVFDALYAWPAFLAHRWWFAGDTFGGGQFAVAWAGTIAGLTFPALLGHLLGGLYVLRSDGTRWAWLRRRLLALGDNRLLAAVFGAAPAPRAWDFFFSERPIRYLRVRRTDGGWVGGLFADLSYAGAFPHGSDLLLEQAWPVDADGAFGPEPLGYSLWIPSSTIAYVEIVTPEPAEEAHVRTLR